MKKTTIASIVGIAFLGATIGQTYQNPERPNPIGKAFFSAVSFKDSSLRNMTSYGYFLHGRYVTDLNSGMNTRYADYYQFDYNKSSKEERYVALMKGPQKGIQPFVEEALIAYAATRDCSGPIPTNKDELKMCVANLAKLGVVSFPKDVTVPYEVSAAQKSFETSTLNARANRTKLQPQLIP